MHFEGRLYRVLLKFNIKTFFRKKQNPKKMTIWINLLDYRWTKLEHFDAQFFNTFVKKLI